MHIKQSKIWKFFSSIRLAIWLFALIALFSLIGTLIPQNQQPAEYIVRYGHSIYRVFLKTGLIDIYSAWWFILLLVLLSLNLVVCLFNRFSLKIRLLGTLVSHISILVILAGALLGGFYGEKGYIRIREGESINSFMAQPKGWSNRGKPVALDFSIRLDDFIYEENIDPEEKLLVYSGTKEILSEIPAEIGSETEIADSGYKIKIRRYVPDFVMDISTKQVISKSAEAKNPALEVELSSKNKVERFWVFARYPDFHKQTEGVFKFVYHWVAHRPKDFISKLTVIKDAKEVLSKDVRVNFPLKFGGYSFFQTSYDKEHFDWSGLQVVKDPGVPVVYAGFILLILGLSMIFYINPLLKTPGVKCFLYI